MVNTLYRLKHAVRAFYLWLKEALEGIRFTQCETDHPIFQRCEGDKMAITLAHVDDMLLAGRPLTFLEEIKAELAKSFKLVDLGKARMFVGVEIERNRPDRMLKILQQQLHRRYLESL
jgi:hypothetical protein